LSDDHPTLNLRESKKEKKNWGFRENDSERGTGKDSAGKSSETYIRGEEGEKHELQRSQNGGKGEGCSSRFGKRKDEKGLPQHQGCGGVGGGGGGVSIQTRKSSRGYSAYQSEDFLQLACAEKGDRASTSNKKLPDVHAWSHCLPWIKSASLKGFRGKLPSYRRTETKKRQNASTEIAWWSACTPKKFFLEGTYGGKSGQKTRAWRRRHVMMRGCRKKLGGGSV